MLAAIKMEVMTPTMESPDEGCIGTFINGLITFTSWLCCIGSLL